MGSAIRRSDTQVKSTTAQGQLQATRLCRRVCSTTVGNSIRAKEVSDSIAGRLNFSLGSILG